MSEKVVNMLMMLNMLKMKKRVAKMNHKLEIVETRAAHPTQPNSVELAGGLTAELPDRHLPWVSTPPQLAAHDAKEEEKGGGFDTL